MIPTKKAPKGKEIKKHCWYLHKVHVDVIFGGCTFIGSYTHSINIVDIVTRYCWL